jgi:flavorubredoxin
LPTIYQDLFQFSTYVPPINLSFHQYLLSTDEPLLIHTGNIQRATALIPELKALLNGRVLKYIFISHFEADECGGLTYILEQFPEAKPICSEVTARQLSGFGLTNEVIVQKTGDRLKTAAYELEFFTYPSEMHLWDGLLAMENQRRIFFSSDLMIRFGESGGLVIESNWQTEINNIREEQVSSSKLRAQLQHTLVQLNPRFVATGHGPCLKVE